ncbi:MAG TPA: peptidoglycan-binding protein [Solirubrobacteraceae bacterium]
MRRVALIALAALAACAPAAGAAGLHLGDRPLRPGDRGHDVRVLQAFLQARGLPATVDGDFGPATAAAVRAFQRSAGLPASGVVGPLTVAALRTAAPVAAPPNPPPGAPPAVLAVIAAATRIASTPYVWGGGHQRWEDRGYDCSGSVSYALHGAGMLDAALDSSGLAAWGEPGPGRWITIYANRRHAFMVVGAMRFDTSGARAAGTRWQATARATTGFTARHPAGL